MTDIQQFFQAFQNANDNLEFETIGLCYAENFLFGQPQGSQTIKKEDFLRVLPKRKEVVQKMGQKSSRIVALKESKIDENYIQVEIKWEMTYERERKLTNDFNSATYILYRKGDTFQIIVQIDHQDLVSKIQKSISSQEQ